MANENGKQQHQNEKGGRRSKRRYINNNKNGRDNYKKESSSSICGLSFCTQQKVSVGFVLLLLPIVSLVTLQLHYTWEEHHDYLSTNLRFVQENVATLPTTLTTTTTTMTTTVSDKDRQSLQNATSPPKGFASPFQQWQKFLIDYPNTPGAKFHGLLQEHLFVTSKSEAMRISSCRAVARDCIHALCFGGFRNYNHTLSQLRIPPDAPTQNGQIALQLEKATSMVFFENDNVVSDDNSNNIGSVYNVRRYPSRDQGHVAPYLGTQAACLPLLLAASSVQSNQAVVEFGPFFGLSSKCIALGLRASNQSIPFYVFDVFDGSSNYNAVARGHKWILQKYPHFNEKNTSFLFLWQHLVQDVYPPANGIAGYIQKSTVNPKKLHNHKVGMMSIDSAKSVTQWQLQTLGMDKLEPGTIIFLMDFEFVRTMVHQVFGCFRSFENPYLLPAYVSWNMEHFAFVVQRPFTPSSHEHLKCYQDIVKHPESNLQRMIYQMDQDLRYVASLSENSTEYVLNMKSHFTRLRTNMETILTTKLTTTFEVLIKDQQMFPS